MTPTHSLGVDAACFDLDMNPANLDDSFVLSEVLTPRVGISFSLDPAAGSTNFSESSVGGGGGGGGESMVGGGAITSNREHLTG